MRPLASLTLVTLLFAGSNRALGDWNVAASANLRHDNNVGSAHDRDDQIGDFAAAARLSLVDLFYLADNLSLAARADLDGEWFDHLAGLRNTSLDAALALKKKWGLGAFAAWTRAGVSIGRNAFEDGYRDASVFATTLEFGKRVSSRLNLWTKIGYEHRSADPGEAETFGSSSDVFTENSRTLTANAEYLLGERFFMEVSGLARYGDVISTTRNGIYLFASSKAIVEDPTFGEGFYAYRLEGRSYGARLGANYALSAHSVLGCGWQRAQTHAQGGSNYLDTMVEVTWRYQL